MTPDESRLEVVATFEEMTRSKNPSTARRGRIALEALVPLYEAINAELLTRPPETDSGEVLSDAASVVAAAAHFLCDHMVVRGVAWAEARDVVVRTLAVQINRIRSMREAQGLGPEPIEVKGQPGFDFRTMMSGDRG